MSSPFVTAAAEFAGALARQPPVRAVNYHSTPLFNAANIRRELQRWSRLFAPVSEDDLDRYLASGRWHKDKPGLIIALYDSARNNYDVMLPLVEEAGFIAWFFVLTGFVACPPEGQLKYAGAHDIGVNASEYPDGRLAYSWSELRDVQKRGHVLASHGRSHTWLETLGDQEIEQEVVGSQQEFQKELGRPVRTFVSYGGPAYGAYPRSSVLIDRAGYQFVFSNLKIQRLRSHVKQP